MADIGFRYERNVSLQPGLIRAIFEAPPPAWMAELRARRMFFIGVGTSHHLAQLSKILWRRLVSPRAEAVHSFDFVRLPQPIGEGDVAVLFSHRGTKSYTVEAARKAGAAGALTVGVTGQGSPWSAELSYRLETCPQEDTGAFTKSLTTALAWLAAWTGSRELKAGMLDACAKIEEGPAFPKIEAGADLILLGDLEREWIAREIVLKLQEAAYLPARAFGLEEFLHGPRLSLGPGSHVVCLTDPAEGRWEAVRGFLKTVAAPFTEVDGLGLPPAAAWLGQLFWGQRFTAAACRGLGIDPDSLRTQDPRYKAARENLSL